MTEYEESLAAGTPLAIAIDEVSMLAAQTFGRILRRIQEFEQDYIKTKPPPPRLFILVGIGRSQPMQNDQAYFFSDFF